MAVTLNASTSSGFVQTADTSGTVEIQSNGSTKLTIASTGVSGTVVSGTAVASTSGTSIDFTSIPSWVKRITVMFNGVSTNGTSRMLVQLGDAGGIETTGYVCSASRVGGGADSTGTTSTAGFIFCDSVTAADVRSGFFSVCNVSGNIWVGSGLIAYTNLSSTGQTGGTKTLSETLTQVRITTVNGTDTFDAGTINILYEG